ncbi:MAG TPA: phosphotransferase family protein [Acidimicrobiia bacterium]
MDTAPIRPDERFDEQRVSAYLRAHLPHLVGDRAITFEQFPGGKANLTYLARAGDTQLVLRRPPLGPVAPGAHDMAREHRVLSVLHTTYPKAPQAHLLCDDPEVMGKPFFVMERRQGYVVRDVWPEEIAPDDAFRHRVGENLVGALAELHLVDHEALGLGDLGRPDGFVARQVSGWTDRWNRARDADVPAMDEVARRLAARVPDPQAAALLHNDFKLDNTMIDDAGSIVAVFDWDMSTTGDPLVDLGTTLAYSSGGGIQSFTAADSVVLGDVFGPDDIAERYAGATGFDLGGIDWYRALGLFRIAVIVQQIYIRWVRGQTRDDRFAGLGEIVPPMADAALELL